jgi:hypothetical protein
LTSIFSRAALVAGLAIAGTGLVVVPAEAAGVSTANYYVNTPSTGSASSITPESAVVSGSIDTGGQYESIIPVPSTGLAWGLTPGIALAGEQWNDSYAATSLADTSAKAYAPIDGIPTTGSLSNVSVTITDAKGITDSITGSTSGAPFPVSNGGADNYSDVTFEYDPVSDYDAIDGQPGPDTQTAQDVQVPTAVGTSTVSTTIGAFGLTAQNNTGNAPLTPGTKYYFWLVQQAGATDQAVNVDIAAWADTAGVTNPANATNPAGYNPTYKCYPIAAIEKDAVLNSYYQAYLAGANPQVSYPNNSAANGGTVTEQPAIQGPCIYYYGDTGGQLYYQSPNGTFTTPKLGTLTIGKTATVSAKTATVTITDASAYKASGTVQLTTKAGTVLANGKFGLQPEKSGKITFTLTKQGVAAAAKKQSGVVILTSNWDQPSATKNIKL